jgi:hypothetical protein
MFTRFGDAIHALDKVEAGPVCGISFNYVPFEKIAQAFGRLKRFSNLAVLEFSNTNLFALKQVS